MVPGDIGKLVNVSDPAVSPDGRTVAVTVTRADADANRFRSAIWLVPTNEGPPRQLTAGDESDNGARWSPTGDRVAFVRTTSADGSPPRSAVLVLPVAGGGEAVTVAESAEGIDGLDWSPDGERLAWATRIPDEGTGPDVKDRDRGPRQITTLVTRIDDVGWLADRRRQVFTGRIDRTEAPRQVTTGGADHGSPRWSPDGTRLVVVAGRHDTADLDEVEDLWLIDADADRTGAPPEPERLTDGTLLWSNPSWSPDGTRIAGIATDPSIGFKNARPLVQPVAGGAPVDAAPGLDRTFYPTLGARPPVWLDDEHLVSTREDRGRVALVRLDASGATAPAEVVAGDRCVVGFDARGGTLAFTSTSPNEVGELSVAPLNRVSPERRRTSFTAAFLRAAPPNPVERFTLTSPTGEDLDAWFLPPAASAEANEPWPLLVSVHGGPMTQYGDQWFDEFQLWSSAGFAVVACNPHGSSGREDAFARAIRSPAAAIEPGTGWGGIDADDIVATLDAALERWPVDPARVGLLGGSYGGFMTSWLLARTDRFAAGCSERAVNNLLSEEWSSDVGGHFWRELGVSHIDNPEEYLRMSPATYVKDLTAPILILHSENDLRCNIEQADALFVPLRLLDRDVEYWRFPGEGHELSRSGSPKHRIRRAELIIDFFQRRLGGQPATELPAG
ncbi:MAG: S9 family peptidase [Acidimicrobiia bacterium]|nr:S9 family peptidase [Acidimicrobiia bacterium]